MKLKSQASSPVVTLEATESAAEQDDSDEEGFEEFANTSDFSKRGRHAVSAEAYGDWNKIVEWVPEEYAKTEEQKDRLRGLLSRSFLFASLEESDKCILVGAIEEVSVAEGTQVITQGDSGDFLFIVEKGVLHCIKKSSQGEDEPPQLVKVCEPGDVFGELSLLYNAPRAASVVAITDSLLWKLGRATFTRIVRDGASKKREKYGKFLLSVPLLSGMSAYEISQIADALIPQSFGPDEIIVKEGDPGDTFYILEEGTAEAFKGSSGGLHYETPGEYFGELALIKPEPRAATVKSGSPGGCRVLSLERTVFNRLLGDLEELLLKREYS